MTAVAALDEASFQVHLGNFDGPFDLLLRLIAKRQLDITEVALSVVTDEFISYLTGGQVRDLEETSQFLVVAATLLDLKTARLLPNGEVEDDEDLAVLEARDLLFARLLQYRAFKQVAAWLEEVLATEARRFPRPGGLEEEFARLLPPPELPGSAAELAALAARAMEPRAVVEVSLEHVHAPRVSVAEQAQVLVARLRKSGTSTFRALTQDSPDRLTTVARFLALLDLYRAQAVAFEQLTPLGELTIRWTGSAEGELEIVDDYDEAHEGSPAAEAVNDDVQDEEEEA